MLNKIEHPEMKLLNDNIKRTTMKIVPQEIIQNTDQEKVEVIANCDNLKKLKFSPNNPYVFTEQGVAMLSSVLNSDRAIEVNIQIMRTFSKIRELMMAHKDLRIKIEELEKKYDSQFKVIFDVLKKLVDPPAKPKTPIGFTPHWKSQIVTSNSRK